MSEANIKDKEPAPSDREEMIKRRESGDQQNEERKARAQAAGMAMDTVARMTSTGVLYCVTSGSFRSVGFVPEEEQETSKEILSELMHALDDMIFTFMDSLRKAGVPDEKILFVINGLAEDAKKRFSGQYSAEDPEKENGKGGEHAG